MPPNSPTVDALIASLYRTAADQAQHYRRRALTQVAQLIDFDGALWGTGHLESETFHSVDILGVEDDYPQALAQTRTYNPIYDVLKANPGKTINMQDVMADDVFYESSLYKQFFSRFGVERVMGVVLHDEATGIFTLISLYRFERQKPFNHYDGQHLERLAYHMVQGASQAYFFHLKSKMQEQALNRKEALAICDRHGVFFEAQPEFIRLIKRSFPDEQHHKLPFSIADENAESQLADGKLCYRQEKLGDLYCIALWESSPIDLLSPREQEVVNAIVHGLSFKEAAKTMGVAPSTVSNHLYKVYRKLNIASRSELAELVNPIAQ